MVTNINFLLTISIHCQEIRLWELIKWSPKKKWTHLHFGKVVSLRGSEFEVTAGGHGWTAIHRGGSRIFFRRGCTRLLLYFNTNRPHSFLFLQNTSCIRKPQVISGGGAYPLRPPPRSAPAALKLEMNWGVSKYGMAEKVNVAVLNGIGT